ncbi:sodium:solute symporter family protein [Cesiribacter andamanensis]|uniref:Na(+)/glucose symporter n=1 Tax=Cesiribacter andamanensis AMV16 TaxID=1279009 RepID=M7N866_9BACT|nr:sodium:solute symporter family protein [Cesiribacter andamanensis]EMR03457.1 Na(+)/glucose symporter [Cesiribacter andamanensis AMV16]
MLLSPADWIVIGLFILITLVIGLYFSKQAGKNIDSFFLGGRNLPWWIAGTSMVATTFAADTPLAVTELVATNGIAGNWVWWNMLIGGMLTTFFFAKYWRRAEILTDVEFIEMRYSGKAASFLRGFKALYLGVFMNALVIAWVNLALMSLLQVFFNIPQEELIWYVTGSMLIVVLYSSLSGLLGVAFTDVVQFIIAMTGCIILAWLVLDAESIGGARGLAEKLPPSTLSFFPSVGEGAAGAGTTLALGVSSFLAIIGLQWWASWYPGNEPGGGGYIAQRMMSTRDEKHAVYATLFFQIAHYALRPWPWILVGLAALVLYPDLPAADKKLGYVMAMKDFLPDGLRGLLLVAFFAAYMSTISTQLNWGTSYLINDVYKRFIQPDAGNKQLVLASRLGTLLLMAVALFVTTQINSIAAVWQFLIEAGAGIGLVLILRWWWWRINAWSEIAATVAPLVAYGLTKWVFAAGNPDSPWAKPVLQDPRSFLFILAFTTISWLLVTYLTRPSGTAKLQVFYDKVRPLGNWKPFRHRGERQPHIGLLVLAWLSAVVMAYAILFFIGYVIFANWVSAGLAGATALISFGLLAWSSDKVHIFADVPQTPAGQEKKAVY